MHFADRLTEAIQKKNSVLCVGIDPRLAQLPSFLLKNAMVEHGQNINGVAHAFAEFGKGIVDGVADIVPVVKVQSAFYEEYGFQGVWAFEETVRYAKEKGLLVIADVKRGDIGSTAEAYARATIGRTEFLGEQLPVLDADAVTVSPYLGYDSVKPFIDASKAQGYEKGVFVLVKTSNPSSADLQERKIEGDGLSMAELMAHFVDSWGSDDLGESGYSFLGAVVAGNAPKVAKKLRSLMPQTYFLVPGFGAQGGTAEDVANCFDENGMGAIVNSSRDIIFAFEKGKGTPGGEDYAELARDAAIKANQELNRVRS